jgi:Mg-chelatase subunit ChlD
VAEPLANVADLDNHGYQPGGMTALYDAIAHTVLRTDTRLQRDGRGGDKVLVVVMTDGLENSSTDYDAHATAELVRATSGDRTGPSSTSEPATTAPPTRAAQLPG